MWYEHDNQQDISSKRFTCDWPSTSRVPGRDASACALPWWTASHDSMLRHTSLAFHFWPSWNQPLDGQPYSEQVHTSDVHPKAHNLPAFFLQIDCLKKHGFAVKSNASIRNKALVYRILHLIIWLKVISSFHFVRSLIHLWTSEYTEHLQTEHLASGYPDISSRAGFRPNSFCLCKIPGK